MTTAHPTTTRASCPSVLLIEKQQGKWGQQWAAFQVHYNHQTVPSCALATASTVVMQVNDFSVVLLLGNLEVGQAAYVG